MDFEDINGNPIIRAFNGRVAKYFECSKSLLITYDKEQQTVSDLKKLDKLLSGECESGINDSEFIISTGYSTFDSGGGVLYTVNSVESLSEVDANGSPTSSQVILLFGVTQKKSWSV